MQTEEEFKSILESIQANFTVSNGAQVESGNSREVSGGSHGTSYGYDYHLNHPWPDINSVKCKFASSWGLLVHLGTLGMMLCDHLFLLDDGALFIL